MSIKRRLIDLGVFPLLVTVIGGLGLLYFTSPGSFVERMTKIIAWFRMPVAMPLWQLILILLVATILIPIYIRVQTFRKGGSIKLDGLKWIKLDNVTPTPLCPKCGHHAFIVEAIGQLRCSIKCATCHFERQSNYRKMELLDKVEEKFAQKAARVHLPSGEKK